jgi:class 3 adenylate cyclase
MFRPQFDFLFDPEEKEFKKDPHGFILEPVYSKIEENPKLIGIAIGVTPFGNLLDRLLPEGVDGIIAVLKDNCGSVMSFELSSGKAFFLGYEDLHEAEMASYVRIEANIEMYEEIIDGLCAHDLYLYPTNKLRATYDTGEAGIYTAIVAMAFSLMAILLMVYNHTVTTRQEKTMQTALRTRAIVTSLFPEKIARTLVNEPDRNSKGVGKILSDRGDVNTSEVMNKASKPLADLFPEATVMFGDLVGFTAWSSMREPHQVFTLLETIYAAFDEIATRRGVFKVETVGDCYVAVCGLPKPRKDHPTVMARFAHGCCRKLAIVLQPLAVKLGPDTAELGIRIGLHSGPVTAGVLRGDRARFQLFGDVSNLRIRFRCLPTKKQITLLSTRLTKKSFISLPLI